MITHAADAVGVGVIGAGAVSDQYLTVLVQFPDVRVVMVGDLDLPRAKAQADKYGVAKSEPRTSCWRTPRSRSSST